MTDTLERVFVLIVIIIGVLFIGVGLNVFESFTTLRNQRDPTTMEQTGLVTDSPGNSAVAYKSTTGGTNDQYKNVPTRNEIYQQITQRYSMQIPWWVYSDKDRAVDKILKPSGGHLPNVVLNPASSSDKQVVCKLNENCEDYVYGWQMYCPIGMDRMETGARGTNQRRYNGCYSAGRMIPILGCRHESQEANSMAGGNLCGILSELKFQRVGAGFMMIPRYSVLKALLEKPSASLSDSERNQIIEITNRRKDIVAQMLFSLKSQVSRAKGDKIAESQLMAYYNQLLYNTTIIYQPITDGMKNSRAGFYARGVSIPSIERLPVEPNFNITGKSLGDTTKEPLPELITVVGQDVVATLPGLPIPARIEPPPPKPKPIPVVSQAVSSTTATAPKTNQDGCPNGEGKMNGKCTPASKILQELQYWTNNDRRKKIMLDRGRSGYSKFMINIYNLAKSYNIASGKTFRVPNDPKLNVFEQMKFGFSR